MMPSPRLLHRVGNLHLSPVWEEMPAEKQEAFNERVIAVGEFDELADADKELIRDGELAVAAGLSASLIDPADWGDWALIDEAMDSDDPGALDRALETVGTHAGGAPAHPAAEAAGEYDDLDDVELDDDGLPVEDGRESKAGWVGL